MLSAHMISSRGVTTKEEASALLSSCDMFRSFSFIVNPIVVAVVVVVVVVVAI